MKLNQIFSPQYRPFIYGSLLLLTITVTSISMLGGLGKDDVSSTLVESQTRFAPDISSSIKDAKINVPLILPIPEYLDFCGEPIPLHLPDIRERFEKELYITAHRYYQVVFYLKRAPRVFNELLPILQEENAPEDLLYLSVIESDLIPTIKSPVGAKGLWQFMPATARSYGLRVDKYIDERMHTEKATRAAIQYLKKGKEQFGSWTLAGAAYNMGVARTSRTIKSQKVNDYYKMHMNPETSRYMFRLLAAKVIIEHPELYGYGSFPEEESYLPEKYKIVKVSRGISDIPEWSKKYNTTYYDIKRLNPWIINTRLPVGNYEIKIPF